MDIAISAFACTENRGSEHELGWKCLKERAESARTVRLFTTGYVNPGICEQLERNGLDHVAVDVVDFPRVIDRLLKSIPGAGYQVAAYAWEFLLFFHLLRRFRRRRFDLAVKSTYGSYRWPSFLWCFSRRFEVDPLSGGGGFPFRFRKIFSPPTRRAELARMFFQRLSFFDPFVLLTLCQADRLCVGNPATRDVMPRFLRRKCFVKPDFLKVDPGDFRMEEARASVSVDPSVLKILHVGKLLEWKGVMVVLRALALLDESVRYEFSVMGVGPARPFFDAFIQRHRLNVTFIDPATVPRPDLSFHYLSNDVFAFPSLHGESGFAAVEAKQHGMKLLTLDFSGLTDLLDESDICVRTAGKSVDEVIAEMAGALDKEFRSLKRPA